MGSKFSANPEEAKALSFMEKYGLTLPDLQGFIVANLLCLKVLAKHANLPHIAERIQGIVREMQDEGRSEC